MVNHKYFAEYSALIKLSKEFKEIESYFSKSESPNIEELDNYLREKLTDPEFNLWKFFRNIDPLNEIFYNNLVGFFKYFGVMEMDKFIHNTTGQKLFEYLLLNQNSVQIFYNLSDMTEFDRVKFTCNGTKIYFYFSKGFYVSIDLSFFSNRCLVLNSKLLEISKIEKKINDEWIPVVIKVNGKYFNVSEFIF